MSRFMVSGLQGESENGESDDPEKACRTNNAGNIKGRR